MPECRKVRNHALDAMRGLAAVAVMLFHFRHELPTLSGTHMFESGNLAVEIFFVLSGFVISSNYDTRFSQEYSAKKFMLTRLIRLLPMVWVGVAIGAAFLLVQAKPPYLVLGAALLNALLLPAPGSPMWPTNFAAWSLFYELVANIALASAFSLLQGRLLITVISVSALGLWVCTARANHIYIESSWFFVSFALARVGYSFFLGVLLARTQARWEQKTPNLPLWVVLLATAAVLFIPATGMQTFTDLLSALALSPALVMLALRARMSSRSEKYASLAGGISYPLYAVHYPIHEWMTFLCRSFKLPLMETSAVVCVALVPLSYLLWECYDKPVRKRLAILASAAESWTSRKRYEACRTFDLEQACIIDQPDNRKRREQ